MMALVAMGWFLMARSSGRAVHDYRSGPVKSGSRTGTSFPVEPGQVFTFGGIVLENSGHRSAVLEAIRFQPPLASGMEVVDVEVAGADRKVGYVGTHAEFPPPLLAAYVHPFRGSEVPPLESPEGANGIEIVFGFRVTQPGEFGFQRVEVDYRIGDRRHTVRLEDGFLACAPIADFPDGCRHDEFFDRGE
ncbi:MAG: hypothetical protein ACRDZ7_02655 [Acidimicrobiia bacterium]